MIVRILGEGQLELADDAMATLNELDASLEAAVKDGDQAAFESSLAALLAGVRSAGKPVADDALETSDFVLPPSDASLAEVRDLLSGDGLIPG